ncbi:MAG: DUF3313 domain-containing protein [Candidatus Endonucleobacter bathymodioli]|uniref:DUF3313 domain-containing protein n=1 Tax=Candidatus Endonucleibacter bathymodioli TaxID=539814 RepID=A0AA90NVY9_9GAMM|nr:DUF3313 domain-containing protein [Candidatus Endonucleobacter bathymodioli]
MTKITSLLLLLMTSLLIFFLHGCSSHTTLNKNNTGFLDDYSRLKQIETNSDFATFRWISDKLKLHPYSSVRLKKVVSLNQNMEFETFDSKIYQDIASFLDDGLRTALSKSLVVTDHNSSTTMQIEVAISAIKIVDADMKFTEFLPIGAAIGLSRKLTGLRNKDIELFLEVKITDSKTSEFIGALVNQGVVGNLTTSYSELAFSDVLPTLKAWIKHVEQEFELYAKRQL